MLLAPRGNNAERRAAAAVVAAAVARVGDASHSPASRRRSAAVDTGAPIFRWYRSAAGAWL